MSRLANTLTMPLVLSTIDATIMFHTVDVDTLNSRFCDDSRALEASYKLHAIALPYGLLLSFLPTSKSYTTILKQYQCVSSTL